jgi:hypothetical protein
MENVAETIREYIFDVYGIDVPLTTTDAKHLYGRLGLELPRPLRKYYEAARIEGWG